MSWESSVEYQRLLNTEVRRRLGGTASADLIIRSYNFAEIEALQQRADWAAAGRLLAADARTLEAAGAEVLILCTNTMHKVAEAIEDATSATFLHIADVTADAVQAEGLSSVALLGTRYTMEQDFYRNRLEARGMEVLIPEEPDRTIIHDIIFNELVQGRIESASRTAYIEVINRLLERDAEGVVAGCTEIELLVHAGDLDVPYFPTTTLHAHAAIDIALG